jgi:hypothetical protein
LIAGSVKGWGGPRPRNGRPGAGRALGGLDRAPDRSPGVQDGSPPYGYRSLPQGLGCSVPKRDLPLPPLPSAADYPSCAKIWPAMALPVDNPKYPAFYVIGTRKPSHPGNYDRLRCPLLPESRQG